MRFRSFIAIIIFGVIFFYLPIIILNFYVDPYEIIRKNKNFYNEYIVEISRYKNAGLIKNYKTERVFIGTSLIQNIFLDNYYEIFETKKKMKKLILPGSTVFEYKKTLEYLIEENYNLEKVYVEINPLVLLPGSKERRRMGFRSFPDYLYKNSYLNFYYLTSFQTLKDSINTIKLTKIRGTNLNIKNFNEMYKMDDKYEKSTISQKENFDNIATDPFEILISDKNLSVENMLGNYEYLLELVETNPSIQFEFFFMPKYIYYYKLLEKYNYLDMYFSLKSKILDMNQNYSNLLTHDLENNHSFTFLSEKFNDNIHLNNKFMNDILTNMHNYDFLFDKKNLQKNIKNQYNSITSFKIN